MEINADTEGNQAYKTVIEDTPDQGVDVNNANLDRAKNEAHPRDTWQMMGTKTNQTNIVKFAQWNTGHDDVSKEDLDRFVDTCWQTSDDNKGLKWSPQPINECTHQAIGRAQV